MRLEEIIETLSLNGLSSKNQVLKMLEEASIEELEELKKSIETKIIKKKAVQKENNNIVLESYILRCLKTYRNVVLDKKFVNTYGTKKVQDALKENGYNCEIKLINKTYIARVL